MQASGRPGCSSQVDEDTLPRAPESLGKGPTMEGSDVRSKDPDDEGTRVDSPILWLTAMTWGITDKVPINQVILFGANSVELT